jgi:hypothetical protein
MNQKLHIGKNKNNISEIRLKTQQYAWWWAGLQ